MNYKFKISGGLFEEDTFIEGLQIGNIVIETTKKGKDYGFIKWFSDVKTKLVVLDTANSKENKK